MKNGYDSLNKYIVNTVKERVDIEDIYRKFVAGESG